MPHESIKAGYGGSSRGWRRQPGGPGMGKWGGGGEAGKVIQIQYKFHLKTVIMKPKIYTLIK